MVKQFRVLVVDDSALYRKIASDAVTKIDSARLCGYAKDGKEALEKIESLKPDIVTLDVEMPILNGIETLKVIAEKWPKIKVIMVTSLSKSAMDITIDAIEKAAFGFIIKPDSPTAADDIYQSLKHEFTAISYALKKEDSVSTLTSLRDTPVPKRAIPSSAVISTTSFIAIGISTGGPNALSKMIPQLPADLPVPVVLVQHMPVGFTAPLAATLDKKSKIRVKEAENGEIIESGTVYIAPGGKQFKVSPISIEAKFGKVEITDDPPENFCKPSVDYLFRSLSSNFPGKVVGVIMTGMGSDGTTGLKLLKRKGAVVIGQDMASCTVYGMPNAANIAGVVDKEVPLESIAGEIVKSIRR